MAEHGRAEQDLLSRIGVNIIHLDERERRYRGAGVCWR